MKNSELEARSKACVWHPCTQMQDHEWLPLVPIKSADGVWLEDFEGKRYLDAISSWWTNLFGHRHPLIVERLKTQLDRLDHVLLAGFTHEPAVTLAEKLCALAPKPALSSPPGGRIEGGLTRCFYADNGSSAVEVALKMSHHYWRNSGQPGKRKFIALDNGYHGETLGALAVGGAGLYRDAYEPLLMDCIRVPSPDCYQRGPGESWEDYSRHQFIHMQSALEHGAGEISAVIIEPLVQCAGGMRMYHPIYLKMLREACTQYGVHLIADEIAVGFGRTGKMFACEWASISPDFLCLAKGLTGGTLPLSVVLTGDNIYQAFYAEHSTRKAFLHSHSYSGNPLACAAALATLEIFGQRDWMAQNRDLGHLMWMSVAELLTHPHVAEIRQQGMILAIELVKSARSRTPYPPAERRGLKVYQYGLKQGVLLRPLGDVIYFMPPYTLSSQDVKLLARTAIEG
ncbi:MAG: adenosylmethionine--8-amino-7-oxononanoate transaminase, partial [Hydrocarboniphaga effusa]|nr:adenosylmethionine--8-amino-7-oxononanoate transaminase [Hydrocarboniphaga effusa]